MTNCKSCNQEIHPDEIIRGTIGFESFYQCPKCEWYSHEVQVSEKKKVIYLYDHAPYDLTTNDLRTALSKIKPATDGPMKADSIRHETAKFIQATILMHIAAFAGMVDMDEQTALRYGVTAGLVPQKPRKEFDVEL